jgi:transcription initiation factor TFIIIB Brf1 subunit/transcription initiation factor TFIIB
MSSQSSNDEDYYRGRALEERIAAEDAAQANVAQIHEELARLYDALADHPELRPVRKVA